MHKSITQADQKAAHAARETAVCKYTILRTTIYSASKITRS